MAISVQTQHVMVPEVEAEAEVVLEAEEEVLAVVAVVAESSSRMDSALQKTSARIQTSTGGTRSAQKRSLNTARTGVRMARASAYRSLLSLISSRRPLSLSRVKHVSSPSQRKM